MFCLSLVPAKVTEKSRRISVHVPLLVRGVKLVFFTEHRRLMIGASSRPPKIDARWAPSSYKWSYNPYKWPYK